MATFLSIVRSDADFGYTASFPDFPGCAVGALTVELVIAKAREALLTHVERLLAANQRICAPTAADAIALGDAMLLAAVEVPDDLRMAHIDLAIPILSLTRIESFARRHGLTASALFVEAVNRWAMQETVHRERRGGMSDGPTLFDFGNPLEFRVEAIGADISAEEQSVVKSIDLKEEGDIRGNDDVTAELARLLEERAGSEPRDGSK